MRPETQYARSGDVSIAYQVFGDGPIDLVVAPGWIFHIELAWEEPTFERTMERLARNFRVMLFDKRGTGLSDRSVGASSLEERMDDIRAVMDAADSKEAVVFGWSEGGTFAAMFAATYPERTRALICHASGARFTNTAGFSAAPRDDLVKSFETYLHHGWGSGLASYMVVPSRADDDAFRRWFGRYERMSVSPSEAIALFHVNIDIDVRHILPTIKVPTLILGQPDDRFIPIALCRDMAERIPGAKFVELSGIDHLFWFSNPDEFVGEFLEFVTGARPQPEVDFDRVLATVLFADVVGSTERASELGDKRWRSLLDSYYAAAKNEIERFRGRQVKTLGDGVLATFDGPARAVRCAHQLAGRTREIGLELRTGVHTGEIEIMGDDVGGIAVHIGARVSSLARPGEVLVSSTVKDLVAGSGIEFDDRGPHELKGVPGEWRLYAARN